MSSHINDSKTRKHKHEIPNKQNLHANNRNTKLLVVMALSTKYHFIRFCEARHVYDFKTKLTPEYKETIILGISNFKSFIHSGNQFHLESKEIFIKQV